MEGQTYIQDTARFKIFMGRTISFLFSEMLKPDLDQSSSSSLKPPISSTRLYTFFMKGMLKSGKSTSQPYRSRRTSRPVSRSSVVACFVHTFIGVYVMSSFSSMPPASAEAARRIEPLRWRGRRSRSGLSPPSR